MARLVDRRVATLVARRAAGRSPLEDSHLLERLRAGLERAVPRSEELVGEFSGIPAPPPVRWALVDRAEWAAANVAGMATLLAPLEDRLGSRLEALPVGPRVAQKVLVSTEIGVLLGYVARRVLGQYDVLVPEAPAGSRAPLSFVGPNIVDTERRFGFVPDEFALWVSLHEVTHRFQFEGVPWLREHFLSLVRGYLEHAEVDARGLAARLAAAARRLATGSVPPEERNPVYLLAGPEQRQTLDDIQALMSVVEGHGNFVMDSVGTRVLPSLGRMRAAFDRRRRQLGALQRAINAAIGLDLKLRQYELGQRFCEQVAARAGHEVLRELWVEPARLPTLAELREPGRWLGRVAA